VDFGGSSNYAWIGENNPLAGVNSFYLSAGSGAVGAPSHSFYGDVDTGFYSYSADNIGITAGGTMQGYIGSQYLYMGDAASFGGGYAWANDVDTYISNPSSNQIKFTTGGTFACYISNQFLYMGDDDSFGGGITWANDTNTYINNPSADHIQFNTGGGNRAEFDNTGLTLNTLASGTGTDLVHDSNLVKAKSSSKRYKKNIIDINLPTDDIYKLRPTTFTWKENEKIDFGLIAEEVEEIIPQLVTYNSDSLPQAVRYDLLSVLLLTEIKKMKEEIKELKEEK
jgi:hypothetical protein